MDHVGALVRDEHGPRRLVSLTLDVVEVRDVPAVEDAAPVDRKAGTSADRVSFVEREADSVEYRIERGAAGLPVAPLIRLHGRERQSGAARDLGLREPTLRPVPSQGGAPVEVFA